MRVSYPVVPIVLMWTAQSHGLQESSDSRIAKNTVDLLDKPRLLNPIPISGLNGITKSLDAVGLPTTATPPVQFYKQSRDIVEGRGKKKYKKHDLMLLTKMMMGLKVALLGIVLPLGVIAAKVLSWKAVTLSLLAYMLAKIVFVKNLFMSKSSSSPPVPTPSAAPAAPIIIHSSGPSHESLWKRTSQPKIHLQPEVHVHQGHPQAEEQHTPAWTWAEESRGSTDPHHLAFSNWLPKITQGA